MYIQGRGLVVGKKNIGGKKSYEKICSAYQKRASI
jgi:hypothetical protein